MPKVWRKCAGSANRMCRKRRLPLKAENPTFSKVARATLTSPTTYHQI
ncbi:hypothetical protein BIFPSEUDO_04217 [Bifidobacterium pseudocatenulatum DSM 20438 = JCM 1200 = LMG 10505]|uniref:Uncharacterized protein n=1 Tax=Bifidobacterium pseudocatenulatum DSM 20438 = JCM 1200 = LMG 10505 TaxID=547043 RepID=C0BUX8_BIFPS|nr:hypothetical protein BIFPSEUDO_04217 [Bifidobacterium pseudocatenulatum DSM 20438 = JCM 1200 = LMG 10505]